MREPTAPSAASTAFAIAPVAHPSVLCPSEAARRRAEIDELADAIAVLAARLDAATGELLRQIRRFDEQKGWAQQGALSCAHWLSWRIGIALPAAREKVRTALALGGLPLIAAALERGELSYAKVRAMTRVADAHNETLLLDMARGATGAQLERVVRGFRQVERPARLSDDERRQVRRRHLPADGMVRIEMTLLPDEAERVWQALQATKLALRQSMGAAVVASPGDDAATATVASPGDDATAATVASPGDDAATAVAANPVVDATAVACRVADATAVASLTPALALAPALTSVPNLADAAVAMAEAQLAAVEQAAAEVADGHRSAEAPSRRARAAERRQLIVELREDSLAAGRLRGELADGTPLAGETLLRLACDSGIAFAKRDATGRLCDLGRLGRTVSAPLLRALWLRDRHCRFPGCTHRVFVAAHHVRHWAQGGETSLLNTLLLCDAHHRLVHEGGFYVEHDAEGEFVFRDPDGRILVHAPVPMPVGDDPCLKLTGVPIDRRTSLPHWDGRPLELGLAVRALVSRAERAAAAEGP